MKRITRKLICLALAVVTLCLSLAAVSFAEYDPSEHYYTDDSGIKHPKTLYGASYVGMNVVPDLLYKDFINPEYETKVVLWYFKRTADDISPIIEYAKTLGTDIPVEISTEPYPYGAWGDYCGSIVWNNGHPDADPIGTEYYYAEPDHAITPVVNGTTTVAGTESDVRFSDVAESAWYYGAVRWGVSYGVVRGTSATTFSPDQTCTQAQIITLIHRQMGSPAPVRSTSPYDNVKPSDYYYNAVLWAAENAVFTGSTFDPDAPCTRADTVLYLWRAKGSPAVSTDTGFTDVVPSAEYAGAVAWADSNGIVYGTSATTFSPASTCTRGQIVTILHRFAGSPAPKAGGNTVHYKYAPDVPDTHQYAEAINYCIENRIFKLDADGQFRPDRTVSIGELMGIFNRIRGWRYADDDYNWNGKWPSWGGSPGSEFYVDYDNDGYNDFFKRLCGGGWGGTPYTYTVPYEYTAESVGYALTDPEPWWFKDAVSMVWYCTQGSVSRKYAEWAEKPLNKSAFYGCLGGFCLTFVDDDDELPIVYNLPVALLPYEVLPEALAGMGFDVDTLTKADENAFCSGWSAPRASYAFRYGFITPENSSTMADEVTLGEVCQRLYELGLTYNCRWIDRTFYWRR